MTIETKNDKLVDGALFDAYLQNLVNQFFKILPIREREETSLTVYLQSLQLELMGCKEFLLPLRNDARFLTLIAILQFFIDNPETDVQTVKREVFRAINICNKLRMLYTDFGGI